MSTLKNTLPVLTVSLLLLAGGCSDDNIAPVGNIPEKTYTSSNGLQLFYNGAEMPGKSVSFSQNGDKATLTAFSDFDLSQLSALGLSGELPCPGVIPGSVENVWNVNLIPGNGSYSFSGQDNNGQCSYKFSGTVTPEKLVLNITDAVLTNTSLSGKVWKTSPIIKEGETSFKSLPVYIDWEFDPLSDVDINLSPLLESLTTLPVIPVYGNTAYMSLSQALQQIVRSIVFRNDGNIIITYISTVGGAARIAQTQPNSLFYTPAQSGTIKLLVNPLSLFGFILENTSGSTPPDEVDLTGTGLYPTG
ncbi:MAG: DUF4925 domain-containing protein, partial [Muribaculaceae bacterium]|nr:DUF4925 domain-containing protein [Muribaculaceae bacterium]